MAQENEYISDAAETLLQSNQDLTIRSYCEAVEEARRVRRGLEMELEQAQTTIQNQSHTIQTQTEALQAKDKSLHDMDEVLQAKDAEIARLKAQLEAVQK